MFKEQASEFGYCFKISHYNMLKTETLHVTLETDFWTVQRNFKEWIYILYLILSTDVGTVA